MLMNEQQAMGLVSQPLKQERKKMKKLIIGAVVAVAAVCTQAASVAWTITGVKDSEGSALGKGHAYVFFVQQDSGKADTSAWAALAGKGATALLEAVAGANYDYKFSDLAKGTEAGTWSYNSTTAGGADKLPSNADAGLTGSTKYSPYAVIFDTDTITDASKFMITTAASASATNADSAGTTKTFILGNQSTASDTWYAVKGAAPTPEPTSALLLVLGMAGLALKRKRA